MKIKCPFFGKNCDKEFRSEAALYLHLNSALFHDSPLRLAELLYKIHEKIESIENQQFYFPSMSHMRLDELDKQYLVKELKYFLE